MIISLLTSVKKLTMPSTSTLRDMPLSTRERSPKQVFVGSRSSGSAWNRNLRLGRRLEAQPAVQCPCSILLPPYFSAARCPPDSVNFPVSSEALNDALAVVRYINTPLRASARPPISPIHLPSNPAFEGATTPVFGLSLMTLPALWSLSRTSPLRRARIGIQPRLLRSAALWSPHARCPS